MVKGTQGPESLIRWQYVAARSRISSAVLTHTNGRGSAFHASIQAVTARSSSSTDRCTPRRSCFVVSSANHRSTRFNHDE